MPSILARSNAAALAGGLLAGALLGAPPARAQTTDPAAIDRAVAAFTGVPIGAAGGALRPADPRLRLAPCPQALELSWHGRARALVKVACATPRGWQIFIPIAPRTGAGGSANAASPTGAEPQPARIRRGDPLSVIVRGRGFSVQQAGAAGENGQVGDWIAVITARGREPVRARIERPGLAIIELR